MHESLQNIDNTKTVRHLLSKAVYLEWICPRMEAVCSTEGRTGEGKLSRSFAFRYELLPDMKILATGFELHC